MDLEPYLEIEALTKENTNLFQINEVQSKELIELRKEVSSLEFELNKTIESYNNMINELKKGNNTNLSIVNESFREKSFGKKDMNMSKKLQGLFVIFFNKSINHL